MDGEKQYPLGDSSLIVDVPTCPDCGSAMDPRVFFGYIYGWRCNTCSPLESKCWSGGTNGKS